MVVNVLVRIILEIMQFIVKYYSLQYVVNQKGIGMLNILLWWLHVGTRLASTQYIIELNEEQTE